MESITEQINRWENEGRLVKNCKSCMEFYYLDKYPMNVFAPRHKASINCESGKKNHCTCDICF